jgi:GxxExxY protein
MYDDNDRKSRGPRTGRRSMPLSELDPELTAISHKVIGLATEVHMAIGPGYADTVYQEAMAIALEDADIAYKSNHEIEVEFDGHKVGTTHADLFIDEQFILDIMAEPREISGYDRTRLRAQLRAADVVLGLVINFAGRRLKDGLVRVLNPDKLNAQREEHSEEHTEEHTEEHAAETSDVGEASEGEA